MIEITGNKNQIIKDVKLLKLKKIRDEKNQFFIEGTRFFDEALDADCEIQSAFFSQTFSETLNSQSLVQNDRLKNIPIYLIPDKIFNEISDTENPQGILCVIKKINRGAEILKNTEFAILLDSIQDPGNLGTIIRTADAAGADTIILSQKCVDIYNPKVLRATMGSVFHINIIQEADLIETIKDLKMKGVKVFASNPEGAKDFFGVDLTGKIAVIIGNEANGISAEVISSADESIKIPMPGKAESLNASVAAAVIAFERVRQRRVL